MQEQTAKAKAANPAAEAVPCMHNIAMPWIMTTDIYTVRGDSAITVESITFCPTGGIIKVVLSGQVGAGIVITGSDLMVAATSGMWAMVMQIAARSVPTDLLDDLMLASLALGLLGAGNLSKTSEDTGNLKDSVLGTVSGGMDYITARGAGALDMLAVAGDGLGKLNGLETNFSENVNNAAVYASDGLTDIIEQFVEDKEKFYESKQRMNEFSEAAFVAESVAAAATSASVLASGIPATAALAPTGAGAVVAGGGTAAVSGALAADSMWAGSSAGIMNSISDNTDGRANSGGSGKPSLKVPSNSQANKLAQQHGYSDAHDLKESFVGKSNISKFDIKIDKSTKEIFLEGKQSNTLIPTGLYE